MNKSIQKSIVLVAVASTVLTCVVYAANVLLLSQNQHFTPADASFLEGVIFASMGALFLIGSGGITRGSQRAAMLAATAGAISDEQSIGPGKIYRQDVWKTKGFKRLGLTLIITGIALLAIYFASL